MSAISIALGVGSAFAIIGLIVLTFLWHRAECTEQADCTDVTTKMSYSQAVEKLKDLLMESGATGEQNRKTFVENFFKQLKQTCTV